MKKAIPNLEVFSSTLRELASQDQDIVVVTSDSRGSGKLVPFAEQFPGRHIETGIAEQNLVGMAAGLASAGKKVFAVSPACFLTTRALEQIKNDVAYSDNPVKLIGISAGVSYGALGSTHHSLHDYAVLRAIHNMCILAPADSLETREAVMQAARMDHPVYIRLGKKPVPRVHTSLVDLVPGRGIMIKNRGETVVLAAGECVHPALEATDRLYRDHGIQVALVSMPSIKPLDTELLGELAGTYPGVITVEEHSVHGGLGDACASYLLEEGHHVRFKKIAIPDEDTVTGSQDEIFNHYGISAGGIAETVLQMTPTK